MKKKILFMVFTISSVCTAFPFSPNTDFLTQSSEIFATIADKAMPATVFITAQGTSKDWPCYLQQYGKNITC